MGKNSGNGDLEQLKTEVSLLEMVKSYGFSVKKHGSKDFVTTCPFHDDTNPSLIISPDKNLFHCPVDGIGGSVIDWVMKMENLKLSDAIGYIRKKYLPPGNNGERVSAAPEFGDGGTEEGNIIDMDIADIRYQRLLKKSFEYFRKNIKHNSSAIEYLAGRGLVHNELLDTFQVGFADNSFIARLPSGAEGRAVRQDLKDIGLLTRKGRLLFTDCLVFPIFDVKGNIVEIYARRIDTRKNLSSHLYLPGKHKGVFNLSAFPASREIILCESILDALSFWVHGLMNVSASFGTNGFTDDILNALVENKIERVYIAYDNDESGNAASEKLAEVLEGHNIESFRVEFPEGIDANEYIGRVKSPAEDLKLLIKSARLIRTRTGKSNLDSFTFSEPKENDFLYEKEGSGYLFTIGHRKYKALGLEKNLSHETLKIYLKVFIKDKFHLDNNLDLFNAKARRSFIHSAGTELEIEPEIIKKDIARLLNLLEEIQDEMIQEKLSISKKLEVVLSKEDREEAIEYLRNPKLIDAIVRDFEAIGLIGEEENSIIGYIAASSRKDDRPLAVIVQSSSGAGKTTLMDAILSFMPDEDIVKFSALTGQSLYYMETNLKHKILAIVEEEGAERASYSLKLLQSEGKINIASTGKDQDTGKMVTRSYEVEGPVMIFISTTDCDIDPELKNRCLLLTIDEDREQTKRIHKKQRELETLDGIFMETDKEDIRRLHKNIQRLLRPIRVSNPFAKDLTFPDTDHRARRDQMKYLTLIRTITYLHQYQREIKTVKVQGKYLEYIETEISDIELANGLAVKVFGTSLDELAPQTRIVLEKIYLFVRAKCKAQKVEQEDFRFTKRDLADYTGMSITQLGVHLRRLTEEHELLIKHSGKRGQTFVYELIYRGEGRKNSIIALGLMDTGKLRKKKR